jgi:pimeloyl-ACP methyl ester carboxylesterase
MSAQKPQLLDVGTPPDNRQIAFLREGTQGKGLFWLGGYNSDMMGNKAQKLLDIALMQELQMTRFDYMAHGQSSGDFLNTNISKWLEDAIAVFEHCCDAPQILIGSSMGGWLALLLNQYLRAKGDERVKGLILIAPAVDMTRDLVPQRFTQEQLQEMKDHGHIKVPSAYSDEPYIYTYNLIEDGARHLMFGNPIETGCPVHILQGQKDPDVPPAHAQKLLQHLMLDEASLSLIPDGDHRLSRDKDLDLLERITISFAQKWL